MILGFTPPFFITPIRRKKITLLKFESNTIDFLMNLAFHLKTGISQKFMYRINVFLFFNRSRATKITLFLYRGES